MKRTRCQCHRDLAWFEAHAAALAREFNADTIDVGFDCRVCGGKVKLHYEAPEEVVTP